MALDIQTIRQDFPILGKTVYNKPLIYLDNGATTQKPRCVVEKMVFNYYNENANIHRGVHFLSQAATEAHEEARQAVQHFLNARSSNEIVFTRGTTESIKRPLVERDCLHPGNNRIHQPDCLLIYRRMYVGRRRGHRFCHGAPL